MSDLWIDSVRCFDAIARLREAPTFAAHIPTVSVGDTASDDLLAILVALVDLSRHGCVATTNAVADAAMVSALDVIGSDR